MAILSQKSFKTQIVKLQSVDGGEVAIKQDISYKLIEEFNSKNKSPDEMTVKEKERYGMEFLLLYIVDWNLTDEKEVKLPITVDNILLLGMKDVQILNEAITDNMKKKES
jgi:hypothetical protein